MDFLNAYDHELVYSLSARVNDKISSSSCMQTHEHCISFDFHNFSPIFANYHKFSWIVKIMKIGENSWKCFHKNRHWWPIVVSFVCGNQKYDRIGIKIKLSVERRKFYFRLEIHCNFDRKVMCVSVYMLTSRKCSCSEVFVQNYVFTCLRLFFFYMYNWAKRKNFTKNAITLKAYKF